MRITRQHLSLAVIAIMLLCSTASFAAPTQSQKKVMVWMGLERTDENIASDLKEISQYRNLLTGVSYEAYNLGPNATLIDNAFTNVGPAITADGLETYPMVSTCCPWGRPVVLPYARELFANPGDFIANAMQESVSKGFTGFNIDIEPPSQSGATEQDAADYAAFVSEFADSLHTFGKKLTIDVASYDSFWDFSLLAQTSVDQIMLMDTYTGNFTRWQQLLKNGVDKIGTEKLSVGLETVNPNTNLPLTDAEVAERFDALEAAGVTSIAIWDAPVPANFWPYIQKFMNQ